MYLEGVQLLAVAPFTGAWIEISDTPRQSAISDASLPSRERGLKYVELEALPHVKHVAPFTGAWIEIYPG